MSANRIASRDELSAARTIVVKVGSSVLASLTGGVDRERITDLAGQLARLVSRGRHVVLVSSGAVAAGMAELGLTKRPENLPVMQAAAAVGQSVLMAVYRAALTPLEVTVGQVLLTRDGLQDRQRFLHARNTLRELLTRNVLPIVNENDTVAVDELKLRMGDNDNLAVNVAQLVEADCLALLSDVSGLYDRHPDDDTAQRISQVEELTDAHFKMAGAATGRSEANHDKPLAFSNTVGTGGMQTKLTAARAAGMAGIPLVVADGRAVNILHDIFTGEDVGTFFAPREKRTTGWKQWIAFSRASAGEVVIDAGAHTALTAGKKSLLAIGVREIRGDFSEGDTVSVVLPDGEEIARGLVNFSAAEAKQIAGCHNNEQAKILDYTCCETVIHRDNLVVFDIA